MVKYDVESIKGSIKVDNRKNGSYSEAGAESASLNIDVNVIYFMYVLYLVRYLKGQDIINLP